MWFIHKWKHMGRQLGSYGMGLETFDVYTCEKCGLFADRLTGGDKKKLLISSVYPSWQIPCVGKMVVSLIRKRFGIE